MRIIKTQQDFDVLRNAKALPAALLDQVEDYFLRLKVELENDVRSQQQFFEIAPLGTTLFFDHEKARRNPFAPTFSPSVANPQPMRGKVSLQARCGFFHKKLAATYDTVLRSSCFGKALHALFPSSSVNQKTMFFMLLRSASI